MSKPIVAIVGRPNVGKSTLFNALAGRRISIVQETPGVTRDRIYVDVEWLDKRFTMIDTGGIEPESAVKFLAAHEVGVTVQQLQAASLAGREIVLPALRAENGRYRIDEG